MTDSCIQTASVNVSLLNDVIRRGLMIKGSVFPDNFSSPVQDPHWLVLSSTNKEKIVTVVTYCSCAAKVNHFDTKQMWDKWPWHKQLKDLKDISRSSC